jgi:hypothetical protein
VDGWKGPATPLPTKETEEIDEERKCLFSFNKFI